MLKGELFGFHFGHAVELACQFDVMRSLFVGGKGVFISPGFTYQEDSGVCGIGEAPVGDAPFFLQRFFNQRIGGGNDFFPFFWFDFDKYV